MKKRAFPTDELLCLITKALSERFKDDPSKPGVLVAHLPEGRGAAKPPSSLKPGNYWARSGNYWARFDSISVAVGGRVAAVDPTKAPDEKPCFYLAAQRFTEPMGQGRKQVCEPVCHEDFDEAVKTLAERVCEPSLTHRVELARVLGRDVE